MKEENKIMYGDDEAAEEVTITGWQSRDGYFYGKNEHLARWAGCTHLLCECGAEMTKGYTLCKGCREKKRDEVYQARPFKQWDDEPLTIFDSDTYFFDESELLYYCEEHECKPEDLRLMICEPQYAWEMIPDDIYSDILAEDSSIDDVDSELSEAFEALNQIIRKRKTPISCSEGKYRTAFTKNALAA